MSTDAAAVPATPAPPPDEEGVRRPLAVHWFLPTSGDARGIVDGAHAKDTPGRATGFRAPSLDYLEQVAVAADRLGYEGVLTPTGTWCEDAWLVTSALIRSTERLKFLVAFRPGLVSPTLAAQMTATFQRLSGGRLLLNVVTGGDENEMRRFGDWLQHDERYDRTREFLEVVRGVWDEAPLAYEGTHYRVADARTSAPPDPRPEIFFGGSSEVALPVAAAQADVYLTWGEPPAQAREKIERVRELAAAQGRTIRFGVRLHVITRDRSADAWDVAQRFLDDLTPEQIAGAQRLLGSSGSVGQQRMVALHGGGDLAATRRARDLEIHPGLWAGVGLVRGGAGTALVGSHEEVADLIEEYRAAGFDELVLSGYPHLEEAYWFAEGVRPLLDARGLTAPVARAGGGASRTHAVPF
ncbi:LLM class flavin-dependent oxidoreductase [Cellulosimicrobium cellulans]|uniref:LLM class flavin-dependent oxidoreductase n=1 Tax=Cellulosimicrobium cellulans TaxID=1710 RepID=UPI001963B312|nr:LLM class flavin-dependent oxidoreductase [Cellulosimicrobium cellulans]MBN0039279.1 LLM class flavin-dependent oxidoreductase [Cellulosimicrobium cellulans]